MSEMEDRGEFLNPPQHQPIPDCMMPDGAEPCAGFRYESSQRQFERQENDRLRARVAELEADLRKFRNAAADEIKLHQDSVAELEAGMLDLANRVMPKMRARVAQLEDHNKGLGDALAGYVDRVAKLEAGLRAVRTELPNPGSHEVNEVWSVTCIRQAIEVIDTALGSGGN